jgi:hypothetical protein
LTEASAVLATASSSTHRLQMECLGIRGASQRGRTECVPPRKPPIARSPGLPPQGHLTPASPPGGAGSARPRKRLRFRPGDRPIRPPGFRLPPNDYVVPRLASGLTTRTHRVRPSEKTTLRVIPEFSPWGNLTLACPPHGGAGSARPLGNALVSPWYAPVRSPASRLLPAPHGMPGLVYGPTTRARRPRPSEKITFRVISGPSPLGDPRCASPRRGGAGSARPEGGHRLDRGICPLGHRLIVNPSAANGMPRHSWGLATRTHRVRPSEKTACRAIFGSAPVRPSGLRLAIPRRGGLRTPARRALA